LPAVRDAAVAALVDSGLDRAHRGLVPLLTEGEQPVRLRVLRRMESVHGVSPVDAARIKLVREGEIEVAAVAWRQLAVGKHARAKALTVDLLERIIGDPKPPVAAEVIGGLVRVRDADFYPVLLRYGSIPGGLIRNALKAAVGPAAEDPVLLQFLVTQGLDDPQPAAREAAKVLLAGAPVEVVRPLVERIRTDLRAGRKKSLELAAGLHDLLAKDPSWRADLAALADGSDLEGRMLGLSMLLELGADAGIGAAQQGLGHKTWEMRSLAMRYLARCRDVTTIPLLIARHGREEGRLAAELDHALFAHTGTRCGTRREWENWWEKHRVGFVLPHADTVRAGGASGGGKTVAYHGIPIVSDHIYFLVDRSGSMRAPMQVATKKTTRLDEAKEQLVRAFEALPAGHQVNLVAFETGVQPRWESLQTLNDENRADLVKTSRALPLGAGTNIFDALEFAFADPKVDTIYLLTDGEPTMGRVQAPDEIAAEVRRWNRTRQIVIHCIGLGTDSELLKRLARESGGTYKFVQ
ncbi:MAG: VWA domain-containing protein, partial [Planctomycetota bacterium]